MDRTLAFSDPRLGKVYSESSDVLDHSQPRLHNLKLVEGKNNIQKSVFDQGLPINVS